LAGVPALYACRPWWCDAILDDTLQELEVSLKLIVSFRVRFRVRDKVRNGVRVRVRIRDAAWSRYICK